MERKDERIFIAVVIATALFVAFMSIGMEMFA